MLCACRGGTRTLAAALRDLDSKEREIVRLRFGLEGE
jgi:DNA-directed RNA polymerase sigma subunit (sigma70/sigma32)